MSGRFEGKVAVVTGAASGLGFALAQRFASEGAKVLATDVAEQGLARVGETAGVRTLRIDVSDASQIQEMIDSAIATEGGVDVLCNNAGVLGNFRPAGEATLEDWDRIIGVNLSGPFFATRAVIPHMVEKGGGVIVNISSVAGLAGAGEGAAYVASKHGLVGLSRNTAVMYAQDGIRCIAFCPGGIESGIATQFFAERERGLVSERGVEVFDRVSAANLRIAPPEEMAAAVAFLASEEGVVINGAAIEADGGWRAH